MKLMLDSGALKNRVSMAGSNTNTMRWPKTCRQKTSPNCTRTACAEARQQAEVSYGGAEPKPVLACRHHCASAIA